MKKLNHILVWGAMLLPLLLAACGEDRWAAYRALTGRDLWIDSVMRHDYLWADRLPAEKSLNYFQEPATFLKSLLTGITDNQTTIDTLYTTPEASYGFDYTLYRIAGNDTAYNALITYVTPQSPAAQAGLERGEWIMMLDEDYLTKKTESVMNDGNSHRLLVGQYFTTTDEEGNTVGVIQSDRNVQLTAARPVEEVVMPAYRVLVSEPHRVGYLAYNAFEAGTRTDSEAYYRQLLQLSSDFKAASVTDFVLDLRYNAGGQSECVRQLASLLVPANRLGTSLAQLSYNAQHTPSEEELLLDETIPSGGANLDLQRVFILTSSTTAGAAEMLINCLRPHMEVILIGSTTAGQRYGTATYISDTYQWALSPVVCEVFNANGEADYDSGFTPDVSLNDLADPAYVRPLGDPGEALLNVALGIILGTTDNDGDGDKEQGGDESNGTGSGEETDVENPATVNRVTQPVKQVVRKRSLSEGLKTGSRHVNVH